MAEYDQTTHSIRRMAGYVLAVAAGALLSWVVILVAGYLFQAYPLGADPHCLGLARLGWIGPLLIMATVGGLAFYLGYMVTPPGSDHDLPPTSRCVFCGNEVNHAWRICPFCGALTGKTKDPDDEG